MTADKLPSYKSVPVDKLIPYANNARTHSAEQVAQIAASIKEFGFINPVIIDGENGIVAGHGRVLAAQKLGRKEVPCIEVTHLTDAQRKAYILADNKLALNAGWDDGLLRIELEGLKDLGFDLSLAGFSDLELGALLEPKQGLTDPDETPEIQEEAVACEGEIWILGSHRLTCGDSTNSETVDKVLAGVKPHLMVTDPPYGVEYDANWRLRAGINKEHQARAEGKVENDHRADWREAWALFPGEVAYVWHAPGPLSAQVLSSLHAAGFECRMQVIWVKPSLVIGRGHYHMQHEPCWYAVKKGKTAHWAGDRKQSTVWHIPNMHRTQGNVDDGKTNHSTQKPVECMKRPIENNSSPGQAVYEPFSGSGTTIIACEMTGRICFAIELNPLYVDMAIRRWQAFTGNQAKRLSDGALFDEVASGTIRASA